VEIHVREWGSPDAPPLVYWHGLNPFGALELNEAGPVWAEEYGLHVLAPEAPGLLGSSPLPPAEYRPTALARRIVELLDARGLDRVAYAGWSWGATIGCHLAAAHGDRLSALVLLDAGYTSLQDDPSFEPADLETATTEMARQQRVFRFPSWEAFLEAAREQRPRWRPALEERLRAGMCEEDGEIVPRSNAEAAAAAWHGVAAEPPSATYAALARLHLPILVLAAGDVLEEEWAKGALARFRSAVPHADVRVIEGSGHDLLADAPEQTIQAVGVWLRDQGMPAPTARG